MDKLTMNVNPWTKEEWNPVVLYIQVATCSFFITQVFPTVIITAILSCISILVFNKIRQSQNLPRVKFDIVERSYQSMAIVLKFITVYGAISWLIIPLTIPDPVLAVYVEGLLPIWQVTLPYYYAYFSLLTSISFLSYLGIARLEIRVNPYPEAGIINYINK